MFKGRIMLGFVVIVMAGCSINSRQTIIIDTVVHHIGTDTLLVWRAPYPEAEELTYTFKLKRTGSVPFHLLFIWTGSENVKLICNGDAYYVRDTDIAPYADSLREPFINCWSDCSDWDTTEIFTLRYLIEEEGFLPAVISISNGILKDGDNVLIFTTETEEDFQVDDYMFSHVLVSNDEAVNTLPGAYIVGK